MSKVKSIITAVLCGLSTFNIMPTTDYSQYYTRDARVLSSKAWKRTGNNLRKTIEDFGRSKNEEETKQREWVGKANVSKKPC